MLGPVKGLLTILTTNTCRAKLRNLTQHTQASQDAKRRGPEKKHFSKTQELKPSNLRVKAQDKPTIPKTKRKRNPPELSHNSFKKPQTHVCSHMLGSV
ncbi:hypothetical protein A6R68_04003 [Neotoma lepida]|uniref:DUF4629 domain-containing protein n=1 Tax=Neotoma lepida TaxID=56216 RepID=A0A1A6GQ21_NEOLE|nr:hypothetical protein A6R68_04003 [Neotoma lepida]